MFRLPAIYLAACCLLAACQTARADEKPVGAVEVVAAETFRCRTLAADSDSTTHAGFLRTLSAPKGKSFLIVWARLKPKWAKNEDGANAVYLPDESMTAKDSKGATSYIVGTCSRDGNFYEGEGYIGEEEEYFDGPTFEYNPVFLVADAEQEFTLQLASTAHKVTAPMKIEDRISPTRIGMFKVDGVRVVKSLSGARDLRRYTDHEVKGIQQTIVSPSQSYLVVKISVKPTMGNSYDGEFYAYSSQFGVRYGAQVYVAPIGYFDDGDFNPGDTGISAEADAAGEFSTESMELVFPMPGRLTAFRALYMLEDFGGAAIPGG